MVKACARCLLGFNELAIGIRQAQRFGAGRVFQNKVKLDSLA